MNEGEKAGLKAKLQMVNALISSLDGPASMAGIIPPVQVAGGMGGTVVIPPVQNITQAFRQQSLAMKNLANLVEEIINKM